MIFFINPLFSITQSFSQEKALLRAYLGLSESMAKPITNPIEETRFYYGRFLGFLIYHLEKTIAEIEAADTYTEQQTTDYTPEEVEAYDSLFGDAPTPAPKVEDKLESAPASPETLEANEVAASENVQSFQKPEIDSTEQIFNELQSESLKERMLGCKNRSELESLKAENPETVTKIWDSLTIPEKNLIKCINAVVDPNPKNRPAMPFDLIIWYDALGQKQTARYCGFYLYGQQIKNEDDRVIYLTEHDTFKAVGKHTLKAIATKQQKPCPPELVAKLEAVLSKPEDTEDTPPTAEEIAALNFIGLAPAPKHENGSQSGKKPDSNQLSEVAEKGDLIEVSDPESGLNGKIVEVEYPIRGGAVCCFWEGRSYCIPKNGYSIFQKNILNSPKA